jgi:hypothetical protein
LRVLFSALEGVLTAMPSDWLTDDIFLPRARYYSESANQKCIALTYRGCYPPNHCFRCIPPRTCTRHSVL